MKRNTNKWDWMYDNEFISYKQLIDRLRKDLNNPEFFAFDLYVPHNEEEYKQVLESSKRMLNLMHNAPRREINIDELDELRKELHENN